MKLIDEVEKALADLRNADARTQAEEVLLIVAANLRSYLVDDLFVSSRFPSMEDIS